MSPVNLPGELWRMILLDLELPRRNALYPFLTVSRAFHDIVSPLIYEFIHVSDDSDFESDHEEVGGNTGSMVRRNLTWTNVPLERLRSLLFALEANGEVAQHTTTFAQSQYSHAIMPTLRAILSQLHCLNRLYLFICNTKGLTEIIQSIPPCVALSHLSIPIVPLKCLSVGPFIQRQSKSLRHLVFGDEAYDTCSTFPTSAMEALDIFEGTFAHRWDELPPLRHLITAYFDPSLIRNPGRVFANVVSLKASTYNPPETIALIGPHLTSLQFLHLSSSGDASEEIRVHDFTKISSDRLTYIHYFKNAFDSKNEVAELEPVFARHPSLLAVDIDRQKAVYQPSYPPGYRFYRNSKSPIKYSVRETDMFECWWEPVQESLESEQAII